MINYFEPAATAEEEIIRRIKGNYRKAPFPSNFPMSTLRARGIEGTGHGRGGGGPSMPLVGLPFCPARRIRCQMADLGRFRRDIRQTSIICKIGHTTYSTDHQRLMPFGRFAASGGDRANGLTKRNTSKATYLETPY